MNLEHPRNLNTLNMNLKHPKKLSTNLEHLGNLSIVTPIPWKPNHKLVVHLKPRNLSKNLEHAKNLETWAQT
jgi:hypothetical protein